MKKCSTCNRKKGLHLFYKNRGKPGAKCKSCRVKANKKAKIEIINYLINYFKEHHCMHCGEDNPILLEFDHLRDKQSSISAAIRNKWSVKKIQKEMEKCQVLCSNCHTLKTAREQNWYMLQILEGRL